MKIEAETATNSITEYDSEAQFHIYCLIHRTEEQILTSNTLVSLCQNFELIDQTDEGDFNEMHKEENHQFNTYLTALAKVESLLKIQTSSLARVRSFEYLKNIDKTMEKDKEVQNSP